MQPQQQTRGPSSEDMASESAAKVMRNAYRVCEVLPLLGLGLGTTDFSRISLWVTGVVYRYVRRFIILVFVGKNAPGKSPS